jgi:hypothetical protein
LSDRYRIERELGAGGMATVYLARDLKHDRQVAIKVLRPELAAVIGAERFLSEIKTTANLQHPHILSLFDSGQVEGTVFYVMPFVDGESLRDRLAREKQLPIADAVRIAGEVADALQYAHDHGVIHRDIKPENILLHGGHALVADFGIALAASKTGGARMTETGMSLGTPQYMSPEQAMGERELDARTDVYALGCTTYEMLAGEPPFTGPTAQAIVAKVMTADPVEATSLRKSIPGHVADAVHTALQKLPADRFATASAFADALRNTGPSSRRSTAAAGRTAAPRQRVRWAAEVLVCVLGAAAAFVAGRRSSGGAALDKMLMHQRTYRTQAIFTARYSSNAEAFVYSAAESGNSPRIYAVSNAYPEPRAISDSATHLLAVSSKDELAVLTGAQYEHHRVFTGTLARMPLGGGTPRELVKGVRDADWSRDGSQLAIVRVIGGRDRLEYPIGTTLYETAGYLSDVRIAPDGQHIAFNEHPEKQDDRGFVVIVGLDGKHAALTGEYSEIEGLAWAPDGKSVVVGVQIAGAVLQLQRVTLRGKIELAAPGVGDATIQDIAPDGRELILREDASSSIWLQRANAASASDLSWLNHTFFPILSGDGSQLVFGDAAGAAGNRYGTMLRRTDGTPAVRLGEGAPLGVSRDKQWVLSGVPLPVQLVAYPTGVGTAHRLDHGEFAGITAAAFVNADTEFVVCGNARGASIRCYVGAVAGGPLRPFLSASVRSLVVSPDGASVVANVADSGYRQVFVRDGTSRPVAGLDPGDAVLRFSPDGKALWTRKPDALPVRVERIDLASGARSPLLPPFGIGRPGLVAVAGVTLADDPRTYVYIDRSAAGYLFELTVRH